MARVWPRSLPAGRGRDLMTPVARPRILLAPTLTELEWPIRPLLEEWADVAFYDAPGVGAEPPAEPFGPAAVVERGLAEVERLGWDRCVVVGDEFGAYNAVRLAAAQPSLVQGLGIGHACLSSRTEGPRAPVREGVLSALNQLMRVDHRAYARALTQVTRDAYGDDMTDRYIERVPQEIELAYFDALGREEEQVGPVLQSLGVPLLLAEHADCALWTREGFDDVAAAFPQARVAHLKVKPSASPEFADLLREFCAEAVAA